MASGSLDWTVFYETVQQLSTAEKLRLIEEVSRSLREETPSDESQRHRDTWDRLQQELAALPVQNPADGFSSRQHNDLSCGPR